MMRNRKKSHITSLVTLLASKCFAAVAANASRSLKEEEDDDDETRAV